MSNTEIAIYLWDNVAFIPHETINVYKYNDHFCHTRQSMEFRDEEHVHIYTFSIGDTIPGTYDEVLNIVTFQRSAN